MALVSLEFGKKMVSSTGLSAIEHVEVYGVPNHANTVGFPAERGDKLNELYRKR